MAGARDRLAREGEVAIVELELVKLRHALERARRGRHQLRPDPVSGETGNGLDGHLGANLLEDVVEGDGHAEVGELLEALERAVDLVAVELAAGFGAGT